MTLLERFCIEHALVLIEQLQQWKEDYPQLSLEAILTQKADSIHEARWLDALHQLGQKEFREGEITILPLPKKSAVRCKIERIETQYLLMASSPVVVAVTLNPFCIEEISRQLAIQYPGIKHQVVCVTPKAYQQLCVPQTSDSIAYPSPHIFDVDACAILKEGILIEQTSLCAWILVPTPLDPNLKKRFIQQLGKYIYFIEAPLREFKPFKAFVQAQQERLNAQKQNCVSHSFHIERWSELDFKEEAQCMNALLDAAIRLRASDIHLEPKLDRLRIRFRIQGKLYEQAPFPKSIYHLLLSRIKVLGGMRQDIVGKVQDGAGCYWQDHQRYDLRFSITIVENETECVVIRVLYSELPCLSELGLNPIEKRVIDAVLHQESGMIVLTGPTGSGKTTTLYALLNALNNPDVSIVTIEQPIEKYFPDAKQMSVHNEGFTFAAALRSVLRQDPDIIMIGEVRDVETCRTAVQAALTGHLVLTTTHTLDAVGIIERFCGSFQIDPVALSIALRLVISQRLIRPACPHCKTMRLPKEKELEIFADLKEVPLAENAGCTFCRGSGVIGRRLISEMLPVDTFVRNAIASRMHPDLINQHVRRQGFPSLFDQAFCQLREGKISFEEARRFSSLNVTTPLLAAVG